MKQWLTEALEAWGMTPRTARADRSKRALRLTLPVESGRVWVGTLSRDGDGYVFRYSEDFKRASLAPVFEFPDKEREYHSTTLWPFFEVRLPPTDRPDVEKFVRAHGIDTGDTLRMLAELGKRTITSPFEFELHEPSRA